MYEGTLIYESYQHWGLLEVQNWRTNFFFFQKFVDDLIFTNGNISTERTTILFLVTLRFEIRLIDVSCLCSLNRSRLVSRRISDGHFIWSWWGGGGEIPKLILPRIKMRTFPLSFSFVSRGWLFIEVVLVEVFMTVLGKGRERRLRPRRLSV